MAYNRKMRKFEGTCYIPGEQLAMMAKYYRGANLNLNLTLFEDDLATMQENLDQACWCSKLNEVDRMKMAHMKGNEWRIAHDHCLEEGQQRPDSRNPVVCQALPQNSRSAVGRVDRGTSAHSLYDRERGLVRGGRYQRDDGYDPRCCGYNYSRGRRGLRWDPYSVRENCDDGGYAANSSGQQNPDRRFDMESEFAMSSLQDGPKEIRCAVCSVETCLVCKNHLFSPICQCKCPVANAALCNKCYQEPCEEEEEKKPPQETKTNKIDLPTMMMSMMMGSILNPPQSPVCCCRTTRDDSESTCSDSSEEKVHKVYLYDGDCPKKGKNQNRKSSSDSSACDCCRCSHKSKKNSKATKGSKSNGSDAAQKNPSKTRKGTKESGDTLNKSSDEDNKKSISSKKGKEATPRSVGLSTGDNRSVSFTKLSSSTHQRYSSQSDDPKELRRPTISPQKSPPSLGVSELIAQHNLSDLESSKTIKKSEEPIEEEDSSTTFNLREFIVSLPKIQSNLQNLMSKLNQIQNNQPLLQQMDRNGLANAQRQIYEMRRLYGYPLIASHQNPLHNTPSSLYKEQKEQPVEDNACQTCYFSVPNAPPAIYPGSSADEPKFQKPSNAPTGFQSSVHFTKRGETIESVKSPQNGKGKVRVVENRVSEQGLLKKMNPPVQSPSLVFASQNSPSQISGSQSAWNKESGRNNHYQNVDKMDKSDLFPQSKCSIGSSLQIVELPGTKQFSKNENLNQKCANASRTFTPPSRNDIFHSYKRSPETTFQDLTEYASFTEGRHYPLPSMAVQRDISFQRGDGSVVGESKIAQHDRSLDINFECLSHNLEEPTLPRTPQISKANKTVSLNAQEQSVRQENSLRSSQDPSGSKTYEVKKDQGVGPGKFCRSKSDTSLHPLTKRKLTKNKPDASNRPKPPLSSINYDKQMSPPRRELDKINTKTTQANFKSDQAESLLEVTSAYVKQDTSNQMYFFNSFVQAVNENQSVTDSHKMFHGMASSSLMNTTNAYQFLPNSSEELDIIPMLPVSSSVPGDEPLSSENPSGPIDHQQDSSDNEVNVNTPGFLRKSQVQAEQLKKAHETIRSMIKNVNDVIAQIDSDSKMRIKSKGQCEDNIPQSYILDEDDGKESLKRTDFKHIVQLRSRTEKPGSSEQNPDFQDMFQRVKRVINSPTPSEHSNVTGESHPQTEDTQPSRARRDYFVLNSESTTTAFTESLRRSLENEASGSLPLTTIPVERKSHQRPKTTRPLKRRSWCPPPKQ